MEIRKIMVKKVKTVPMDTSVQKAVKIMNKNRINCLVVTYDERIAGIITERDLLERVLEKGKDPKETAVSEIMTRQVLVGKPTMELVEASKFMFEKKVKKLPIMEKNRLVGIVTLTDIARATCVDEETMKLIKQLSNMHTV
ncbi:MAG TPA: CBS domain-containing protein [Candidatus Bathyarchaeota archaeon]|nr:CBS domain-containing protein [Candidatus Bathyarchaeota archaeon]